MSERIELIKPLTQPLESGEYARSVDLGEENPFGVPADRYLITNVPGEVDTGAKLTLGQKQRQKIVTRFSAEDGASLALVKVDSRHRKPRCR